MGMTNTIKGFYEKMPKGMKFMLSPVFIRLMVKNKTFKATWDELDRFEKMTSQEQAEYQLKKLKDTLVYAYENVPYYKQLFDENKFSPYKLEKIDDIKALPILEKDVAVEAGDKLYSTEPGLKYYRTSTGGSSGKSLTVLLDKDSIYKERAVVTHFMSRFGYDPLRTKTVLFLGHNKDQDFYYSPLKNEIVIAPFRLFSNDNFQQICDDIEKFGATFLTGYPSAITLFVQMLEKTGRKMKFDHVVYFSENCSDEDKAYIEKQLGVGVDSYYGHTERSCFAEIKDGKCTFNDFYGLTELLPTDDEKEFRIVCTGFMSHKMPLIRYATDDVVRMQDDGSMVLIGHRRSEVYLISKNGQKVFKGAMTIHLEELKKVKRYQYYQDEPGKAELRMMLDSPLTDEELKAVEKYITRRCEGLLDIKIVFVDEIKLSSRGKYIWAISNL
jgi:phenylacetate-coenzyme A ligase PaaK-like adenylate-forming protein